MRAPALVPKTRRWLRCIRAAVGLAAMLALATLWLLLPKRGLGRGRKALSDAAFRVLCAGLGLRIRQHGRPSRRAGMVYAANHVSWTDIAALAITTDAAFVAKREVRGWPLIGRMAARYGCLFVERGQRGAVPLQVAEMAGRLGSGLVLFAEGTTSDGAGVLPFRSSLFAAAGEAEGPFRAQPVTIRYRRRDGSAPDATERRGFAWIEDDELLPHALALAAGGGALTEIWFEDEICAADRKSLARACREAILRRLQEV